MDWRDQGILLAARAHGESSAIIEVFTRAHGRHLGVVRGGASRRMAPILQPGAQIEVAWRARLADHLGSYVVEPVNPRMVQVLGDPLRLAALSSLCASCAFCLPERENLPRFQEDTEALADMIAGGEGWLTGYVQWELALLQEVGFALDLGACAVTGATDDLAFVSPKSGRAVARGAAGEWADRLLPLPACLLGGAMDAGGALAALRLTGFFLAERLAPSLGARAFPAARQRLLDQIARAAG